MDIEKFKIYVDRLKNGKVEHFDETCYPDFLEQNDEDLSYNRPVSFKGEVYIVQKELVMHFDIQTLATVRCTICNDPVEVPVTLQNVYHIEPLENIKSGIFIFTEVLREVILLEAPRFIECSGGKCKNREMYSGYMSQDHEGGAGGDDKDDGYHPFTDLDLKL